jgi:predicted amidohydrolase
MPTLNLTIASLRFNVYENHVTSPVSRLDFVKREVRDLCQDHYSANSNDRLIITGPEYMFARKNYTLSEFNREEFKTWDVTKGVSFTRGPNDTAIFANTGQDMDEGLAERRKVAYSEKEKDAILRELKALTAGRPNLLLAAGTIMWREYLYLKKLTGRKSPVFNTAPIVANGAQVHEYNKKNPSDEIKADFRLRGTAYGDQAERYRFVPGTASGCFTWRGVRFGIEICADHAGATLKGEVGAGNHVDIHLMLSAGMMPTMAGCVAKAAGLLISNDGSITDASQQVNGVTAAGLLQPVTHPARTPTTAVWRTTINV